MAPKNIYQISCKSFQLIFLRNGEFFDEKIRPVNHVSRILKSFSKISLRMTESNYENIKRARHGKSPHRPLARSKVDFKTRGSGVRGRKRKAFTKAKKNEIPKTRNVSQRKQGSGISRSKERSKSPNWARGNSPARKSNRKDLPKTVTVHRSRTPNKYSRGQISGREARTPTRSGNKYYGREKSSSKKGSNTKPFVNNNDSPSKRYRNRGYPSPVSGAQSRNFSKYRKHEMDEDYLPADKSYHEPSQRERSYLGNNYMTQTTNRNQQNKSINRRGYNDSTNTQKRQATPQRGLARNVAKFNIYGIQPKSPTPRQKHEQTQPEKVLKKLHREIPLQDDIRRETFSRRPHDDSIYSHRRDRSRSRNYTYEGDRRRIEQLQRSRSPYQSNLPNFGRPRRNDDYYSRGESERWGRFGYRG